MSDSSSSKPMMVTSTVSLKVTAPSFYNQPKKFASVAPPRPKAQMTPSPPLSFISTGVIGRVGEMPPPPSAVFEDFPPPPPPPPAPLLDDAELPAPPPECQVTPPASDVLPPAFPAPPPVAEDLHLPAPPEEFISVPSASFPPPPPPPPLPETGSGGNSQRLLEKQTSFDRQLGSLTDMLSEMETSGPFNLKLLCQFSSAPEQVAPPPTAPKPALSFLPPPELQDRPPPAPWAEELRARTRPANQSTASAPAPVQSLAKGPAVAPKTNFPPSQLNSNVGSKTVSPAPSGGARGFNHAVKIPAQSSFPPPPPAAPPAPVAPPVNIHTPTPAFNHSETSRIGGQQSFPPPAPAAPTKSPIGGQQSFPPPAPAAPTKSPIGGQQSFPPPSAAPSKSPFGSQQSFTPPAPTAPSKSPIGGQQSFAPPSPAAPSKSPICSHQSFTPPSAAPSKSLVSSFSKPAGNTAPPKVSGSGGAPLTMREVEELERMTKDFIKDMDKHPPVITSPATEVCGKCGEALSRSQPAVRAMEKLFHSHCFCCMSCQRPLQGMQFYDHDGTPQCEDCYMKSLTICSLCGERITDRVLKAVGQCFHAHCFRCTTCSCALEGAPFITDDNNNPYCVKDYHRRFSPLCVSCNEPIVPDPGSEETIRVVALEKNFHLKCYRCEDCARPLSIEADSDGCYPLDGRILCMKCHTQRAKQAKQ